MELNPIFSFPNNDLLTVSHAGFPGWGGGHMGGGYSLLQTVHADVTVSNAAFRVVADIPLPAGAPALPTQPTVTLTANEIQGIAGATIHYSGLVRSEHLAIHRHIRHPD